jgi:hypothetical protein
MKRAGRKAGPLFNLSATVAPVTDRQDAGELGKRQRAHRETRVEAAV